MNYDSNTKRILARLQQIRESIEGGAFSDALAAGLNAGMGLMKRRIFNASQDVDGKSFGAYTSKQYAKKRRKSGRQIGQKDLEFQGSLRRSIEVVTVDNTRAEIRITVPEQADIARYQEAQIYAIRNGGGKPNINNFVRIFRLNKEEQEIAQNTTRALLQQKFNF